MVRIRLRRMGKTKRPSYRVVVADSRSPRNGKFIEIIGHYDPVQQPKILHINDERARYWLGVGAKPSEIVVHLFKQVNILDSDANILPPSETQESDTGAPPAAPAEAQTAAPSVGSEVDDTDETISSVQTEVGVS